jgi:hypothetical protein
VTRRIAVGRYARVTTAARVDAIGQVARHTAVGCVVRVPNWQADGWPMEWHVRWDEVERSTATACRAAAKER